MKNSKFHQDMTDSELDEILAQLSGRTLTALQYQRLVAAICNMQEHRAASARQRFCGGAKVKWNARGGFKRTGTVMRVMRRNAQVRTDDDGTVLRVPLSLLEPL